LRRAVAVIAGENCPHARCQDLPMNAIDAPAKRARPLWRRIARGYALCMLIAFAVGLYVGIAQHGTPLDVLFDGLFVALLWPVYVVILGLGALGIALGS
jgi:hypothetical protein